MKSEIINSVLSRNRIVKGWAFREQTKEEIVKIRQFLETGRKTDLPEDYHSLFDFFKEKEK